jgi:hypothetical protein
LLILSITYLKNYIVLIHNWSFSPISTLCSIINPRNINYMPAVIFFACLDFEQKSSFMDGHYLSPKYNLKVEGINFYFYMGRRKAVSSELGFFSF